MKRWAFIPVFMILVLSLPVWADSRDDLSKSDFKIILTRAQKGDAEAQYNLGVMYDEGQGVPQNYKEALKWYTKAVEQGYAEAQCNLGVMYAEGRGVSKNYKEALKWFTKAAEQGYAIAQNNLGMLYCHGLGVPQSFVKAYMWFCLAAAKGYLDATYNRDIIVKNMTPAQIAEAQKLASEWKPKK